MKVFSHFSNFTIMPRPRNPTSILPDNISPIPFGDLCNLEINFEQMILDGVNSRDLEGTMRWLTRHNLLANTRNCEHCQEPMRFIADIAKYPTDTKKWNCRKCKKEKSVRERSIFSNSKLPLYKATQLLYLWSTDCPQKMLLNEIRASERTVAGWFDFVDDICRRCMLAHDKNLDGFDDAGSYFRQTFPTPHTLGNLLFWIATFYSL
uniref:Uncharacterized protein n=1 Tax=Octopus bimaculoides TaxID=37653 RepID=A0A0L8I835_OCTBM